MRNCVLTHASTVTRSRSMARERGVGVEALLHDGGAPEHRGRHVRRPEPEAERRGERAEEHVVGGHVARRRPRAGGRTSSGSGCARTHLGSPVVPDVELTRKRSSAPNARAGERAGVEAPRVRPSLVAVASAHDHAGVSARSSGTRSAPSRSVGDDRGRRRSWSGGGGSRRRRRGGRCPRRSGRRARRRRTRRGPRRRRGAAPRRGARAAARCAASTPASRVARASYSAHDIRGVVGDERVGVGSLTRPPRDVVADGGVAPPPGALVGDDVARILVREPSAHVPANPVGGSRRARPRLRRRR